MNRIIFSEWLHSDCALCCQSANVRTILSSDLTLCLLNCKGIDLCKTRVYQLLTRQMHLTYRWERKVRWVGMKDDLVPHCKAFWDPAVLLHVPHYYLLSISVQVGARTVRQYKIDTATIGCVREPGHSTVKSISFSLWPSNTTLISDLLLEKPHSVKLTSSITKPILNASCVKWKWKSISMYHSRISSRGNTSTVLPY